jgi:hypothetical protein
LQLRTFSEIDQKGQAPQYRNHQFDARVAATRGARPADRARSGSGALGRRLSSVAMAEKKSEEAAFESSAFGAPPVSTAAFFFARSRNTTAPAAAARPALLTRALRSPSLSRARAVPLDLVIVNAHRGPRARLPRGANALLPAPAAAAAAADADRGRKLWAAASGGRCCGEEMGRALCTCPCCGRLGEGGSAAALRGGRPATSRTGRLGRRYSPE